VVKKRLESIQILRGIAALLVVAQHTLFKCYQYNFIESQNYNILGFGVDLFFIISGFVMCHSTEGKKVSFSVFLKKRVVRILPLYWFLTTLALVIWLINPALVNSSGGKTDIISSFMLIPTSGKFLLQNGWTLSYEILFYAIYSLSILISYTTRNAVVSLVIAVLVLSGLCMKSNIYIDFITNTLLLEFCFGIFIYYAYKIIINHKYRILISLVSVCIGLGVIFLQPKNAFYISTYNRYFYVGIPTCFITLGFIVLWSWCKKIPSIIRCSLNFIGDSSYSLYLSHAFILSPVAMMISSFTDNIVIFFSIILISALIGGAVTFLFVEVRLSNLFNKLLFTPNM